ncbi:hypothetical protein EGW08_000783 [Elysia chlorotica]|uniref:Copper type II ascorbate-dependent monooxygenase C-terminal domain-containing protein n=1 Tax=Elysia chlorotica TaxID=188477 RepID=A0A433UCD5_ELYCH|nr:hypothetical protein EGW08_000783 [Elysia chlorotica]
MGASDGCNIISAWTVGQAGQCFGDKIGFRVGRSTYKKVLLEIHYNNPRLVSNYVDSSGLKLYYQPARADFQDLVMFTTGQIDIEIPPGESRVDVVGTCRGRCTNLYFTKPVYVISALNHMHYMGRSMKIELFRQGRKIADITNEKYYNYDSPVNHVLDPPLEIRPGDEIKTTCTFSSLSSNRYVYYGEATSDEMCFGFLTMYPRDAVTQFSCPSYGPLSTCEVYTYGTPIGSCNWPTFVNLTTPESMAVFVELRRNCNLNGFCRPECEQTVRRLEQHPCMQGEAERFVKGIFESFPEGVEMLGRLHSCSGSKSHSTEPDTCSKEDCKEWCDDAPSGWPNTYDGAPKTAATTSVVLLLVTSSLFAFLR